MTVRRGVALALGGALLLGVGAIGWGWFVRPGAAEYARHAYVAPPASGALTATWFGTTALLLTDGTHAVFVDPFFTRPPGVLNVVRNAAIAPDEGTIAAWLQRAGVTRLDAVLVSHSHYDHAMDAAVVAQRTGATLVGSPSTANIGRGGGLPENRVVTVKSGEVIAAGAFKVTFVESAHAGASGGQPTGDITQPLVPPAHYLDYRQGGTYSILIEHPQGTVLHHGSVGFVPGMLKLRRAAVVFLCISMMPDLRTYLGEVVDAVGATRVVPVHWDDFTRPLDAELVPLPYLVDLDGFFADMVRLRPDLEVQTLTAGVPAALFPAGGT